MQVPFVNLKSQTDRIKPEIMVAINEVIDSGHYIQGKYVKCFEESFTQLIGSSYGVGCGNGTWALSLALRGLEIGQGDEVITVPNSFFATVEAILDVGARPVFVDIDPDTYCLDVSKIEEKITAKTKAILPVHIYGNVVNMDALIDIAQVNQLFLVEDAAQAHLAKYKDHYVGTLGDAAGFSFYPGKNLGAFGDAGFITLRDQSIETRIRRLINHGRLSKYDHEIVGYNCRMDAIQAAILSTKLRYINAWTERRRLIAEYYNSLLKDAGFHTMKPTLNTCPSYHLYVTRVRNRQEVMKSLAERGIFTSIHYPVPLHHLNPMKEMGYAEEHYPVTESVASSILSLPMCPELEFETIDYIVSTLIEVAYPAE